MTNILQKRYEGFLKTACLWKNNSVYELQQFKISINFNSIDIIIDETLRLGKYVERFVSFELSSQHEISILAENIQIQNGKVTLGELDCLLLRNKQPIHLEVIYKFYLYDDTVGTSELDHFIGPNRKDTLVKKLTKLKKKQLPLLHSDFCKPYLDKLNLNSKNILQQVYFKAQLFLPFSNKNIKLNTLNNDCISGFYITKNELHYFEDCKFYIPNKKDWLLIPHSNVAWLSSMAFKTKTHDYIVQQFSVLLWVKFKNGTIKKVFLVWW